jgi:hypothetical protein
MDQNITTRPARLKALEEWRISTSSKQIGSSQLYGAAAAVVVVVFGVDADVVAKDVAQGLVRGATVRGTDA